MLIRTFWAEGFRSLSNIHLPDFGPFNVFYGENGAGKSNILVAMDVLVRAACHRIPGKEDITTPVFLPAELNLINDDDFCHDASSSRIRLGITLRTDDPPLVRFGTKDYSEFTFEITFERLPARGICYHVSKLESPQLLNVWRPQIDNDQYRAIRTEIGNWFELRVAHLSYRLIPAVRSIQVERGSLNDREQLSLPELFARGRIKEAFVLALTSPDPVIRTRFTRLRELLSGLPLQRPYFDPVYDPTNQRYDIRERNDTSDVSLDLSGLGVQQIYTLLGQIMLGRSAAVGIEEPEAHLHAPTSGVRLRALLRTIVESGDVRQLFISTHSNLFDLDPTGYFDVSKSNGVTIVKRNPLREIDGRHLYEPGPAKHGLEDLLLLMDGDAIVLRRGDGSPVTARQMLTLLQEDADEAVAFLRDVHGAAVRAVQLRATRER